MLRFASILLAALVCLGSCKKDDESSIKEYGTGDVLSITQTWYGTSRSEIPRIDLNITFRDGQGLHYETYTADLEGEVLPNASYRFSPAQESFKFSGYYGTTASHKNFAAGFLESVPLNGRYSIQSDVTLPDGTIIRVFYSGIVAKINASGQ